MSGGLTLPAPAKLNLFLHIVGRRADGYHELQSVFQFVQLCDQLAYSILPATDIDLDGYCAGVAAADNLIYRAARLLQQVTGCQQGAEIKLQKNIPAGAGLGGGSSDAATTLLALNYLWQTGLDLNELAHIGAQLGADVPVFVRGRAAWAEGIGDKLTIIDLPQPHYVILKPDCAVSTAEVFCHEELTRNTTPIKIARFLNDPSQCRNDTQAVVQQLYPQVADAIQWLTGFAAARLTGTGACVFAAFDDYEAARRVLEQVPERWQGYVARGLNVSPTHSQLPKYKL